MNRFNDRWQTQNPAMALLCGVFRWLQRAVTIGCVLLCAVVAITGAAHAQGDPPSIDAPITDLAIVLSDAVKEELSEKIRDHHAQTGVQLAVLVIDTTYGEPIEDYSLRVANQWKGGTEGRDDGVLFVLAIQDRRMRLEVGYGLEGIIPDATAKYILSKAIPHLKTKDHDSAVRKVVGEVFRIAHKPLSHDEAVALLPPVKEPRLLDGGAGLPAYLMVFFLGSILGRVVKWRAEKTQLASTDDAAAFLSPRHYIALSWKLWMGLYVVAARHPCGAIGGWLLSLWRGAYRHAGRLDIHVGIDERSV